MTTRPDKTNIFVTEHLKEDLKGRSIRGGMVTAGAQSLKAILGLLNIAVLSRLLTPESYGLVAMAGAFMGFLWILTDGGLTIATVQTDDLDQHKASTIFWVNTLFGIGCGLIFAALSPLIAWYYRDPRLLDIALAFAVAFPLKACGMQHQALIVRQMRFRALAVIDIVSTAVGLAIGVVFALDGWSYWSIIAQTYGTIAISTAGVWYASGWHPDLRVSLGKIRGMLHVGGYYSGFQCVCAVNKSIESMLIGRIGGAEQLGVYNRALSSSISPFQQFMTPILTVAFPALSRLATQPESFRRAFQRVYGSILAFTLPITCFLIPASLPIIRILLGPNWDIAVPTFAWLLPSAFLGALNGAGLCLFTTTGNTKRLFGFVVFESFVLNLSILAAAPWGVTAVAMAVTLTAIVIRSPVFFWQGSRCSSVRVGDFYRPFIYEIPLAAGIYGTVVLCAHLLPAWRPFPQVLVMAAASALVYFVLLTLFPFGRRRLAVVWASVEKFLKRKALQPA